MPLLRRCPQLTFLDLTRCEKIRDASLAAVGACCPRLETLLLYATPNLTDAGFEALAPGVPRLTHLDITGLKLITDRAIVALANHCRALRILHLMWVTPLTDASLIAMGSAPLDQLRLLSIHGNVHVTVGGFESLAAGCRSLEQIDVNGCKNIGAYRTSRDEVKRILPKFNNFISM